MRKAPRAAFVAAFLFTASVSALAHPQIYLPNPPTSVCYQLTMDVAEEFKQETSKTWDFEVSYKFLQNLLGRENPHLWQLTPVIMSEVRKLQVRLLEAGAVKSNHRILYESWESCLKAFSRRLYDPMYYLPPI